MVQAAGGRVMVWGIFSWSILEPLVPTERPLNTTSARQTQAWKLKQNSIKTNEREKKLN